MMVALLLSSCSLFRTQSQDISLLLLPPAQGHQSGLVKQDLTMQAAGKEQHFIVVSKDTQKKFNVLVMMPTGQTLLTMEYDGEAFNANDMSKTKLPSREIMAIMQFSAWPEPVVRQFYETDQSKWSVLTKDNCRRLIYNQQLWLEVKYESDSILVRNVKKRYRVKIRKLETVAFE